MLLPCQIRNRNAQKEDARKVQGGAETEEWSTPLKGEVPGLVSPALHKARRARSKTFGGRGVALELYCGLRRPWLVALKYLAHDAQRSQQ